jgi:hypothetical protein
MTARPKPREEMTEEERAIWAKFDAEIQKGIDSARAGDLEDADEFFDRLIAKYEAMTKRRG